MAHRRLLADLSRRAWKVLAAYLKTGVSYAGAAPGSVIAVQTFGDFQNFHPHLHSIATDGCFYGNDMALHQCRPTWRRPSAGRYSI
jgi:peptidase E